jgi:transcription elongation GreA/GreB family factor
MSASGTFKQTIHQLLVNLTESRLADLQVRMQQILEDRNSETKSSAGDKYETGRAMMQQEIDMCQSELLKTEKFMTELRQLHPERSQATAIAGSLVTTDQGIYYIAVGLGRITVDSVDCYAISPGSPFGIILSGKKKGDSVILQGKTYTITSVQ